MNKFKIVDCIYGQDFELIINCSYKEVKKYIEKKYPVTLSVFSEGDAQFISFTKENTKNGNCGHISFIWIEKFNWSITDVGLVVHELQHLVFNNFIKIGMKHCVETDEAYSYYYQYLFNRIYEQLNKWNVSRCKKTRTKKGNKNVEKSKKPVSNSNAPLHSRSRKRPKKRRS